MKNANHPEQAASPIAIWLGMLTVYIVWGSTYLAIRFALISLPPFLMAGIRFLIAGGVLLLIQRINQVPWPTWQESRSAVIMGLFLLLGGNGGVVWAEQFVPSGLAALIVGASPLWMILFEALHPQGSRPTLRTLIGVVIGFLGIAWLFAPTGDGTGEAISVIGVIVLLGASASWAYGSIYSRYTRLPSSPLMASAIEMLGGGVALTLLGTGLGEWPQINLAQVSTESWLGLGYLIIFGSLAGYGAYTWLLRVAPTSLVSTYAYVNPLVAIVLGIVLGNETLGPRTLLAAAIILGSVIVVATRPAQKTTPVAVTGTDAETPE